MINFQPDPGDAEPGAGVVQISGELTVYHAAEFASFVLSRIDAGQSVELDLDGVTEFDSAGMQVLLLASREARTRGVQFALLRPSRPVQDVIELFNLARVISRALDDVSPSTPGPAPDSGVAASAGVHDDQS